MARATGPGCIGPEGNIVPNRLPREQRILLEHHAPVGTGTENRGAVNASPSSGGLNIAGHRVEQCRLAAARRTEQTHERARRDIDRGIFQRVVDGRALPERYRHLPDLDSPAGERLRLQAPPAGLAKARITMTPARVGSAPPSQRRRCGDVRTTAEPAPPRLRPAARCRTATASRRWAAARTQSRRLLLTR